MFNILRVELTNFKSYAGFHAFDFPQKPGLYHLTGENQQNPRLGANAVGKSGLMEAVNWCFYGRTSRGLKAGDVVTWGQKSCSVTVWVQIGDKEHRITRVQNPNSIVVDLEESVDQKTLDNLLRLSQEAFGYTIMMPQFGDTFLDLTPSVKLTLFSSLLELDRWLIRSEAAQEKKHQIEGKLHNLDQTIGIRNDRLTRFKEDIKSLREQHEAFDSKQEAIIASLNSSLDAKEIELSKVEKEIAAYADVIWPSAQEMLETRVKLGSLQLQYDKEIHSECPMCGQKVDLTEQEKKKRNLGREVAAAQTRLTELEKLGVEYNRVKRLKERKAELVQTATVAFNAIGIEEERENVFAALIKTTEAMITATEAELRDLVKEKHVREGHRDDYVYLVKAFKDIRLMMLDESIQTLEIETNSNLTSLGLDDWSIQYLTEAEKKSGGMSKGFTVLVRGPANPEPVKFESWSGAETQLLKLAAALGLSHMILGRAGLTSKVEFYDEPSTHLSQEGVINLVETLHQRAISTGKMIWLVDHSAINFGSFEKVIKVVKDERGSSISDV
jgi:DNA repair exonuclease SbcCD ATPase subunit